MRKSILKFCVFAAGISLLNGCGEEKKEQVNELYHPGQVVSKTLYPKTSSASSVTVAITHEAANMKAISKSIPKPQPEVKTSKEKSTKAVTNTKHSTPTPATKIDKKKSIPVTAKAVQKQTPKIDTKNAVVYTLQTPEEPIKPVESKTEIAKAVEAIKADAAKEILNALKVIKAVKPIKATEVTSIVPSAVDVVKAKAVADIAKATSFAQSASAVAKAKIAQAVAKVKIAELRESHKPITEEVLKKAKEESATQIANAVAATEIAKAKSAAKIARSVADVEKEKAKKYPSLSEKLFGKE